MRHRSWSGTWNNFNFSKYLINRVFFFGLYCEMQNLVFIYCPKSWSVTSGTEIEIVYWACVIDWSERSRFQPTSTALDKSISWHCLYSVREGNRQQFWVILCKHLKSEIKAYQDSPGFQCSARNDTAWLLKEYSPSLGRGKGSPKSFSKWDNNLTATSRA